MTRLGITGIRGVLGRSVQRWWPDAECVGLDGDVRDAAALRDWVNGTELDGVLHFAAIVPLGRVEADPLTAFDVNVRGTWQLLDALKDRNIWTFIASSSHVYAPRDEPIGEEAATRPASLYGLTKLHAEQAAAAWAVRFDMSVSIGRIFSFSGPGQAASYLLPSLVERIRQAKPGEHLPLRGSRNVRDFLTTRQVVAAVRHLFERRASGVYNIGTGVGTSVARLAQATSRRLGREDVVLAQDELEPANALVADVTKLQASGCVLEPALEELIGDVTG
jgi:UDP-glucose 4-epimerase